MTGGVVRLTPDGIEHDDAVLLPSHVFAVFTIAAVTVVFSPPPALFRVWGLHESTRLLVTLHADKLD